MSDSKDTNTKPLPVKKKGPIRWEAIVPFLIVVGIFYVYFHFFFDNHLRRSLEIGGYHALGAEVNIGRLESSVFKGSLRIQNIEITDSTKPTHNLIEIGDVRFDVLWDALLRAKVVIEEMAVEQIKIGSKRKSPGKVKPPEPKKESGEPSFVDAIEQKAMGQLAEKSENSVLGDLLAIMQGSSSEEQLKKIEGTLGAKKMLEDFQVNLKEKQKNWEEKFKALPKPKEFEALGQRLQKVQSNNFKNPEQLQTALKEVESIIKEADEKKKSIETTKGQLDQEIKDFEKGLKDIELQIKKDVDDLKARLKIPQLDAASFTRSLINPYINPYLQKAEKYKDLALKYMPPKFKNKSGKEDELMQPTPRVEGVSYEFGRPNSYPLFWAKKISISSQAGASPDSGNISGQLLNVTTHQRLTGRPTELKLSGDLPSLGVMKFDSLASFSNVGPEPVVKANINVEKYQLTDLSFLNTPEATLGIKKALGSFQVNTTLNGFKNLEFRIDNSFSSPEYLIDSSNAEMKKILDEVFAGIPLITIEASGAGAIPKLPLFIKSNLGDELAKGFQKQINARVEELKKQIQAYVDTQVGQAKAQAEAELAKIKNQVNAEIKKIQDQANGEKQKAEVKVNQVKKDSEEQAKKSVENEAKKLLGDDAQKKIDDLKKKMGW